MAGESWLRRAVQQSSSLSHAGKKVSSAQAGEALGAASSALDLLNCARMPRFVDPIFYPD
jgi:hypothetical protein